jgi:hypothetical protein
MGDVFHFAMCHGTRHSEEKVGEGAPCGTPSHALSIVILLASAEKKHAKAMARASQTIPPCFGRARPSLRRSYAMGDSFPLNKV